MLDLLFSNFCFGFTFIILHLNFIPVSYGVQTFIEVPTHTQVILGETAILKCRVNNIVGMLQWTKDGVALGHDREIPGFARYSMTGDVNDGEYDLKIISTQLKDDAEYDCQVSPGPSQYPLRAKARLEIIVKPDPPVINGYKDTDVVDISIGRQLTLECSSANAKPAPDVTWWCHGKKMSDGVEAKIIELSNGLLKTINYFTLAPTSEENNVFCICESTNVALTKAQLNPLQTSIKLNVMFAPEGPEISGYKKGELVKVGQRLRLVCSSVLGNPPAQVFWYRNNKIMNSVRTTVGDKVFNELIFSVKKDDHFADFVCKVSNHVTTDPMETDIQLLVEFPPDFVKISGPTYGEAGQTMKLKCETATSNPPSAISWYSQGKAIPSPLAKVNPSSLNGYISKSEIEVTLSYQTKDANYQCQASNTKDGKVVSDMTTISILYAPLKPIITGYSDTFSYKSGETMILVCTSVGGNPPASVTWWRGFEELKGSLAVSGNMVTNTLSIKLRSIDNGADFRCNSTNKVSKIPLISVVKPNVEFGVGYVELVVEAEKIHVDQKVVLNCKTTSSNPAATIFWTRNDERIKGKEDGKWNGINNGQIVQSHLEVTASLNDNENVYTCSALNSFMMKPASKSVTLNVLCPPTFPVGAEQTYKPIEDQNLAIDLTVKANPTKISYTWYKDGQVIYPVTQKNIRKNLFYASSAVISDGVISFSKIERSDRGTYICKATNSEGTTSITIFIDVQYSPKIIEITDSLVSESGSTVQIICKVDANPMRSEIVSWRRPGYDMNKISKYDAIGQSVLTVHNVSKQDTGIFSCHADNGIGSAAVAVSSLSVKASPSILKTPEVMKAAGNLFSKVLMHCEADGEPSVNFKFYRNNDELRNSGKYSIRQLKIGLAKYKAILTVKNITKEDYGEYICIAMNELGQDFIKINLHRPSSPGSPYDLLFINSTHNSVLFKWKPGFNGGFDQNFQICYARVTDSFYSYEDVKPDSVNSFNITDLSLNTEYFVNVRAFNKLGYSDFTTAPLRVTTSGELPLYLGVIDDEIQLIIVIPIAIIGVFLLILNIVLIYYYCHCRRNKAAENVKKEDDQNGNYEMQALPAKKISKSVGISADRKCMTDYLDDSNIELNESDESKGFISELQLNEYAFGDDDSFSDMGNSTYDPDFPIYAIPQYPDGYSQDNENELVWKYPYTRQIENECLENGVVYRRNSLHEPSENSERYRVSSSTPDVLCSIIGGKNMNNFNDRTSDYFSSEYNQSVNPYLDKHRQEPHIASTQIS